MIIHTNKQKYISLHCDEQDLRALLSALLTALKAYPNSINHKYWEEYQTKIQNQLETNYITKKQNNES